MSADNVPTTDAPQAPAGADKDSVSAEVAEFREEMSQMRDEIDDLRAENERLRSEVDALDTELSQLRVDVREVDDESNITRNLANKAHDRIHELESYQSSVSETTELQIALAKSADVLGKEYRVTAQRAVVMAHFVNQCGGPGGVRVSDDSLQRHVEHELGQSLRWTQHKRVAEKLADMAGDSIEYVVDDAHKLVIHDDSVLPD
ncbi:hypothetical protein GRS48_14045 [Halorubrum sp. JWXQ-INN 858]|uniref:hypothetical protein n=1 Tax=Halorubrum sp. JWXQ-INN 858 TaxID=2690782 RepID=UPI0013584DA5|nr:hypothetical protein [Halorubrum sp. JWXQ-INN 858]MWV65932.1 hypothetical protein [Halorubrum sp. JWXQ-INN 858]